MTEQQNNIAGESISDPRQIDIADFDYPLPDEKIAKHPLAVRDSCKLLVRHSDGVINDLIFSEIIGELPSGSLLFYNDTKVINARLRFRRATGAVIEVFCLEPAVPEDYAVNFASTSRCSWKCFVGNAKKWKPDETLSLDVSLPDGNVIVLHVKQSGREGNAFIVDFQWDAEAGVSFSEIITAAGEIPIPPYLNRNTEFSDSEDYQTVYAHYEGSVAAPTAGLHFTPELLSEIEAKGIERHQVTLHVGAGTFQPVKSATVGEHDMHAEFISVPFSEIQLLSQTDRPVIAVGTTTVRTLESLYQAGCMVSQGLDPQEIPQWYAYSQEHPRLSRKESLTALAQWLVSQKLDTFVADTRIIIAPSYKYQIVNGLITNFHQPKSTLLLLVSALIGNSWREVYTHALENDYRFLSYGDACLFLN